MKKLRANMDIETKESIEKSGALIDAMKDLSKFKPNEILATVKYIDDTLKSDNTTSPLKDFINQVLKEIYFIRKIL